MRVWFVFVASQVALPVFGAFPRLPVCSLLSASLSLSGTAFCFSLCGAEVQRARGKGGGEEEEEEGREIRLSDEDFCQLYEVYISMLLHAPSKLHLQEKDAHDLSLIHFLLSDLPRAKW